MHFSFWGSKFPNESHGTYSWKFYSACCSSRADWASFQHWERVVSEIPLDSPQAQPYPIRWTSVHWQRLHNRYWWVLYDQGLIVMQSVWKAPSSAVWSIIHDYRGVTAPVHYPYSTAWGDLYPYKATSCRAYKVLIGHTDTPCTGQYIDQLWVNL